MVVDYADRIDTAGNTILSDVREVACITLPHLSERILLEGFPVADVRIPGTLQVILFDEPLDS